MGRFRYFFAAVVFVLGLCGYYLGNRLLAGSSSLSEYTFAVWSGVGALLVLVVAGPLLGRVLPASMIGRFYPLRWFINMMMAIFFSLLFYTFATDLLIFSLSFLIGESFVGLAQEWSLLIIACLVLGTFLVGVLQAWTPKVYRVEVPIAELPKEFDGFKIAQISDLHIGEMIGHRYVRAVVSKTNSLDVDAVAMTGDIIDGQQTMTAPITADLAELKARDGVFYVTGNHEYYWGVEGALTDLKKAGARILQNESVLVRRGKSEIAIVGIPDATMGVKSDPMIAIRDLPSEIVKILLAHQPVSYRKAIPAGIHLQLSGHTHGGQFFPWSIVVRLFQRYNSGLIRHGPMWIYVNRGTATWGPRLRFGIPPEITLLTLRSASAI